VDFLLNDMTQAAFWIAALKIIGINIILSGDNAVVIALACRMLPPKERFWGMILGAGVAVLLRIVFTLVVAEAMGYQWLKLIGGVLLLWVAVKLLVPEDEGDEKIEAASNLWKAVRIVAVADIVMSLDNVIAIAAAAETAAMALDPAHTPDDQGGADRLRSRDLGADDRRGQRVADGAARPLSDSGVGGCRAARLGRGRHHDQGRCARALVQPGVRSTSCMSRLPPPARSS
jgi:YjbE family integral membrane protein